MPLCHLVRPPLRLGEAEIGQQREQDQLGTQLGQAVEAADADVVADQADDPRDQRLVGRAGQARLPRGFDSG